MKKRFWKNTFLAAGLLLPAVFFAQDTVADSLARLLEKAPADTPVPKRTRSWGFEYAVMSIRWETHELSVVNVEGGGCQTRTQVVPSQTSTRESI